MLFVESSPGQLIETGLQAELVAFHTDDPLGYLRRDGEMQLTEFADSEARSVMESEESVHQFRGLSSFSTTVLREATTGLSVAVRSR